MDIIVCSVFKAGHTRPLPPPPSSLNAALSPWTGCRPTEARPAPMRTAALRITAMPANRSQFVSSFESKTSPHRRGACPHPAQDHEKIRTREAIEKRRLPPSGATSDPVLVRIAPHKRVVARIGFNSTQTFAQDAAARARRAAARPPRPARGGEPARGPCWAAAGLSLPSVQHCPCGHGCCVTRRTSLRAGAEPACSPARGRLYSPP